MEDMLRRVVTILLILMPALSPIGLTAQTVVPTSRINALKREYPYVRFEQLMDIRGPLPPRHDLGSAPKPAAGGAANTSSALIPAAARLLHRRKVSIRGWVVPVVADRQGISEFILSSSIDSCHFGVIGGPQEWIYVVMEAGRKIPNPGTTAVTVFGVLDVGADVRDGVVDSLYRMRGHHIAMQ